ncbi:MAG: hypothetical protein AB1500_10275 [Bacillota bacterium]
MQIIITSRSIYVYGSAWQVFNHISKVCGNGTATLKEYLSGQIH